MAKHLSTTDEEEHFDPNQHYSAPLHQYHRYEIQPNGTQETDINSKSYNKSSSILREDPVNKPNQWPNESSSNQPCTHPVRSSGKPSSFEFDFLNKKKIREREHEITVSTEKISQLEQSITHLKREMRELSEQKRLLQDEKESLETSFQEKRESYEKLSLLCEQSFDTYQRDKKSWEKTKLSLEGNLSEANKQIEKLVHEKKSLDHEVSKVKQELEFSNSQLKNKDNNVKELLNTLSLKQEEFDHLTYRHSDLKSEFDLLSQHAAKLEREHHQTKEMMAAGQANLSSYLTEENKYRDHQIQVYFAELEDVKKGNVDLRKENDLLRSQKQKLENKIIDMEEEKTNSSSMNQDTSMLQKTIDDLKEKNEECAKLWIKKEIDYKKEITDLKQSQILQQIDNLKLNSSGQNGELDKKLRSFIPEFFMKLFTATGVKDEKIEEYVIELMNERLDLLDLLEKAANFMKKENI